MKFPYVDTVNSYLSEEFPDFEIVDAEDFDLHAHKFKITGDYREHMLKISLDYASDTDAESLANLLRNKGVAEHMRNPEFSYVLISNDGVAPVKRK